MSNDTTLYTVGEVAAILADGANAAPLGGAGAPRSHRAELVELPALFARGLRACPEDHHLPVDGDEAHGY